MATLIGDYRDDRLELGLSLGRSPSDGEGRLPLVGGYSCPHLLNAGCGEGVRRDDRRGGDPQSGQML